MIQEIPLESEEIIEKEIQEKEIEEKEKELKEKELIGEKEIKEKELIGEKEIKEKELIGEKELTKKPRGRPKGSTKPKIPPEKPKKVAKAKPHVHYQSESSEEEPLPEYVRQQLPERDLASQMMQLLQQHSNKAADARKQMYSSWFSRF
jgi:hypothetical protein